MQAGSLLGSSLGASVTVEIVHPHYQGGGVASPCPSFAECDRKSRVVGKLLTREPHCCYRQTRNDPHVPKNTSFANSAGVPRPEHSVIEHNVVLVMDALQSPEALVTIQGRNSNSKGGHRVINHGWVAEELLAGVIYGFQLLSRLRDNPRARVSV